MSEYLIRYGAENEVVAGEAEALARICELYASGVPADLYEKLPVKLTAKARVVRRQRTSPAPVEEAIPPVAPLESGEEEAKAAFKEGVPRCIAPGCDKPGELNGCCIDHNAMGPNLRKRWAKAKPPFVEKQLLPSIK